MKLGGTWALEFGIAWFVIGVLLVVPTVVLATGSSTEIGYALAAASGSFGLTGMLSIVLDYTTVMPGNMVVALAFLITSFVVGGVFIWAVVTQSFSASYTVALLACCSFNFLMAIIFFFTLLCKRCYGKCYGNQVDPDLVAEQPVVLWFTKLEEAIEQNEVSDGRILVALIQKIKQHLRVGSIVEAANCFAKLQAVFTVPVKSGSSHILPIVDPLLREIQTYLDIVVARKNKSSEPVESKIERRQVNVAPPKKIRVQFADSRRQQRRHRDEPV